MFTLTTLSLCAALAPVFVAATDFSSSLFRVEANGNEQRRGTAFLVASNGEKEITLVTCAHVLIGCSEVKLYRLVDDATVELPVESVEVAFDDPSDLALLRVHRHRDLPSPVPGRLKPLPVAADRFGDNEDRPVLTVGFPRFNQDNLLISQGRLAARLDRAERTDLLSSAFFADAGYVVGESTAQGMSGGPVWSVEDERVVGVHIARLVDFAGVVVSGSEVTRFLRAPTFAALNSAATARRGLSTSDEIAQQVYADDVEVDTIRWGSFDLLDRLLGETSGFRRLFQEVDLTPRIGTIDEGSLHVDVDVSDGWRTSLFVDGRAAIKSNGSFEIDANEIATGEHLLTLRVDPAREGSNLNDLFATVDVTADFAVSGGSRFQIVRALPKVFGGFFLYISYHGREPPNRAAPIVELALNGDRVTEVLASSKLVTKLRPGGRSSAFGTAELTARLSRDAKLAERAARLDPAWGDAIRADPNSPCLLVRRGERHLDVLTFLGIDAPDEVELRRFGVAVTVKLPRQIPIFCVTRIQVVQRQDGTVAVFQRMIDLLADFAAPVQVGENSLLTFDLHGILTQGMLAWANNVLLRPDESRETYASALLAVVTDQLGEFQDEGRVTDIEFREHEGKLWLVARLCHPATSNLLHEPPPFAASFARASIDVRGASSAAVISSASPLLSLAHRIGVERLNIELDWNSDGPGLDSDDPLRGGLLEGISRYLVGGLKSIGEVVVSARAFGRDKVVELRLRPTSPESLSVRGKIGGQILEQELNRLVKQEIAKGTGDTKFKEVTPTIEGELLRVNLSVEHRVNPEIDIIFKRVRISVTVFANLTARFRPVARDGKVVLEYTGFDARRDLHDVRVSDARIPGDIRDVLANGVRGNVERLGRGVASQLSMTLQEELTRVLGPHKVTKFGLEASSLRFEGTVRAP